MEGGGQREFFDRLAGPFLARYRKSGSFRQRRALFVEAARDALPRSARPQLCLDLGCGPGVLSQDFVQLGYDVRGVDLSEEMIARARRVAPSASFVAGDLQAFLQGFSEPAGLIVFSSVLEYLDEPLAVVKLAASKLAPGGTLLLSVPNRRSVFRALERVVPRSYVRHWGNTLPAHAYVQAAGAAGLRLLRLRHFGAPVLARSAWFGPLTLLELQR